MATINLGRVKPVFRGAYSGATAYVVDDIVTYQGSTYICILASTGNLPTDTTYWTLMAEGGDVASTLTTQGDILYRDASGLARLAAGTSGQFLQTQGTGANPTWGDVTTSILQVKNVEKTDVQSWTGQSEVQVSSFEVSLTPSSTSNKILVMGHLWTSSSIDTVTGYTALKRKIGTGSYALVGNHSSSTGNTTDATGHTGPFSGTWNLQSTVFQFLDNPTTTSQCTYSMFVRQENAAATGYINRTGRDNTVYHPRTTSAITIMEIASGVL